MKKIMVVLGAIAVVGMVHASTVKWSVTNVYKQGSDTSQTANKAAAGSYYVMCFLADAGGSSATDLKYLAQADAVSLAGAGKISDLASKATFAGTLTSKGTYASAVYDGNWAGGNTVSAYAIVFDATTAAAATHYQIASGSYTYEDAAEDKQIGLNMKTAAWADVGGGGGDAPEPTSAMLMLLGVAGLALRRKQK